MTHGFTVWLTGLSGSGKSTLGNLLAQELSNLGHKVELLDGDVVRQYLSKGLGFSKEDRDTNIRRIGFAAHLVTRQGGVAITAAISPYRAIRDENRELIKNFVEIFCRCPLAKCEERDVKGLYKKARQALADGKPMNFTGVDDAYEEPLKPELIVDTDKEAPQASIVRILKRLVELGYIDANYKPASASGIHAQAYVEHLPEELIEKAEASLRKAGRVHTDVLVKELHLGFATAARLIDRLAERGKIGLK